MKRYLVLFVFAAICHFTGSAQSGSPTTKRRAFSAPDRQTLVLDSTGKTLTYDEWHDKIITGEYNLVGRQASNADTAFILKRLPDEEIASRIANMPPPPSGPFKNDEQPIEPFAVTDINKFKFKSKDWAGKVLVFNFWFIDCPPCRQEIPELNKIVAKYADDKNIIFIGICLDGKSDIEKFIKDTPFAYHLVPDGRYFTEPLGIRQYPLNMVVDKQGMIRFNTVGYGPHWAKFIDEAIGKYKDL